MSDAPNNMSGAADDAGFSPAETDALLQTAAASGGTDSAPGVGAIQPEDMDVLQMAAGMSAEAEAAQPGATPTTPADGVLESAPASASQQASSATSPDVTPTVQSYAFEPLINGVSASVDPKRVSMLGDVNLRVKVQLGQTRMLVEDVLKLGEGSVVELDKLAGDPVDILVNDRLIARGEVLVLNDNFCVRVNEVISNNPHRVTV